MVLAFGLSGLASLGLAVTYWLGGDPQVEGALLGISLGGLGLGIVGWTKRYMSGGSFVEEREELSHPERLTDAAARDFRGGEELIVRRKVLFRMLSAAVGSLGIALIFPIRSLGPRPGRSLYETPWRKGLRWSPNRGARFASATSGSARS